MNAPYPKRHRPYPLSVVRNGLASVTLVALLAAAGTASAARQVTSFPLIENFDSTNYLTDLLFVSERLGATTTYLPTGGWRGGAAKFTPPTDNEGYSGIGQFVGLDQLPTPTTQLNIRFLVFHGTSIPTRAPHVKMVIANRQANVDRPLRPMIISSGSDNGRFYAPCHGTWCDTGRARTDQLFYVDDYLNQWVSIEFEIKLREEEINIYAHTLDGRVSGLIATNHFIDPNDHRPLTDNPFSHIDGIGFYWGRPDEVSSLGFDANTYIKLDEVAVSNRYIGPPTGFAGSAPPESPANLR